MMVATPVTGYACHVTRGHCHLVYIIWLTQCQTDAQYLYLLSTRHQWLGILKPLKLWCFPQISLLYWLHSIFSGPTVSHQPCRKQTLCKKWFSQVLENSGETYGEWSAVMHSQAHCRKQNKRTRVNESNPGPRSLLALSKWKLLEFCWAKLQHLAGAG